MCEQGVCMSHSPEIVLNFLASFLPLSDKWADLWKKFNETKQKFNENCLLNSTFTKNKKNDIQDSLNFISDRLFFYCLFPWIGGKRLIVRISHPSAPSSLHGKPPSLRIPVLYAKGIDTTLYNPSGAALKSSKKSLENIIKSIIDNNGDIDTIFSLFAINNPALLNNIVIVDIPLNCQNENLFFKPLLAAAEEIRIHPKAFLSYAVVNYLKKYRPNFRVCLEQDDSLDQWKKNSKFSLPLASEESLAKKSNGYIPFSSLLSWALYAPYALNENLRNSLSEREKLLTEDLVLNDRDKLLKKTLEQARTVVRTSIDTCNEWQKNYAKIRETFTSILQTVDSTIIHESKLVIPDELAISHDDWSLAENYLQELIIARDIKELPKFTQQLASHGYPHSVILQCANALVTPVNIDKTIACIEHPIAHLLSCILRSSLELSDLDAGLAHAVKVRETIPEIMYLKGIAHLKLGNIEQAKNELKQALREGIKDAGKYLYSEAKKSGNQKEISFLARNLVPEACLDYATARGNLPLYGRNLFFLYLSAAQYHWPAIKLLGHVEYVKSRDKKIDNDEKLVHKYHALNIYRKLAENNIELTSKELCNCGRLFYEEKLFHDALNFLSKSSEAGAFYLIGRMYHYGDGVAIDLDKAKEYYQKAIELGNDKAKELLEKIKTKEQRRRTAYSSSRDYRESRSYSYSSSSSGGGFCFLTTATCKAKGFDDDCDVLQAYRRFRDKVLAATPEGKELIEEYYRIAPSIVFAIEERIDSREIYEQMWKDYLEPGYKLVLAQKNTEAKDLYIKLVMYLIKKLNLKV